MTDWTTHEIDVLETLKRIPPERAQDIGEAFRKRFLDATWYLIKSARDYTGGSPRWVPAPWAHEKPIFTGYHRALQRLPLGTPKKLWIPDDRPTKTSTQ